jgi:hypothetical protein
MTGLNPFTARKQSPVEPVTPRQYDYLHDLFMQRCDIKGIGPARAQGEFNLWVDTLDKAKASTMIDKMKTDNTRLRELFAPLKSDALQMATVGLVLDDGMYARGETVFKLYHTVHGANVLVAKELVIIEHENGDRDAEFVYRGTAPLVSIAKDGRKLTLEEARQFGHIYGQCCRCLSPLTHEISIALGIGPKCGGHEYGDEFKVLYKAEQARLKQPA